MGEAAIGGTTASFTNTAFAARSTSERTLVFGYDAIYERYLDRVTIAEVAVSGMRGLAALDKRVDARRLGNRLELLVDGKVVRDFAAPGENDSVGWANLTLAVAQAARNTSAEIASADDDKILEIVFAAALAKLDPFSRYASPHEARSNRANRNGFAGIGVRYEDIGAAGVELKSVIPESPASTAGLIDGDVLTHIDGRSVKAMQLDEMSSALRGDVGSQVKLTWPRPTG